MKKYGKDNILVEVLEIVPSEPELGAREIYWIALLRAQGFDLLNLTDGGEGRRGTPISADHKARLSEVHKGNKYSLGRKEDPEVTERRAAKRRGISRPDVALNMLGNTHAKGNRFDNPAAKTSAHKRWHTNQGISKPETCSYCKKENDIGKSN